MNLNDKNTKKKYDFCSNNFTILWLLRNRIKLKKNKIKNMNNNVQNIIRNIAYVSNNDNNTLKTEYIFELNSNFYAKDFFFFLEKNTIMKNNKIVNNDLLLERKKYLQYNITTADYSKIISGSTSIISEYENYFIDNGENTNYEWYFENIYDDTVRFFFFFLIPFFFYSIIEIILLFLFFYKIFNWFPLFLSYTCDSINFINFIDRFSNFFFFYVPSFSFNEAISFSTFIIWLIFLVIWLYEYFTFLFPEFLGIVLFDDDGDLEFIDNDEEDDDLALQELAEEYSEDWDSEDEDLVLDIMDEPKGSLLSFLTNPLHFIVAILYTNILGIYIYLLYEIYLYIFDVLLIYKNFLFLHLKSFFEINFYKMHHITLHLEFEISHINYNILFLFITIFLISVIFIFFFSTKHLEYRLLFSHDIFGRILKISSNNVSIKNILYLNFYKYVKFLADRSLWNQMTLVNLNYVYLDYILKLLKFVIKVFFLCVFSIYFFNFLANIFFIYVVDSFHDFFYPVSRFRTIIYIKGVWWFKFFMRNYWHPFYYYWYIVYCGKLIFYSYHLFIEAFISIIKFILNIYTLTNLTSGFILYLSYLYYFLTIIYSVMLNIFEFLLIIKISFLETCFNIKKKHLFLFDNFDIFNNININIIFLYKYINLYKFIYLYKNFYIYIYDNIINNLYINIAIFKIINYFFFFIIYFFLCYLFISFFFFLSFEFNFFNWLKTFLPQSYTELKTKINFKKISILNLNTNYVKDDLNNFNNELKLLNFEDNTIEHFQDLNKSLKKNIIKKLILFSDQKTINSFLNKTNRFLKVKSTYIYTYLRFLLLEISKTKIFKLYEIFSILKKKKIILSISHYYFYIFSNSLILKKYLQNDSHFKDLQKFKKIYGEKSDLFNREDHKMPIFIFLEQEYVIICILLLEIYNNNKATDKTK